MGLCCQGQVSKVGISKCVPQSVNDFITAVQYSLFFLLCCRVVLLPEIYFHSCLLVIISSFRTWRLVITSHARTFATRTNAIHQLMIISHVSSLFPNLSIKNAWMHTRALLCMCFASVWCRSNSPILMSDLSYTRTFSNSFRILFQWTRNCSCLGKRYGHHFATITAIAHTCRKLSQTTRWVGCSCSESQIWKYI